MNVTGLVAAMQRTSSTLKGKVAVPVFTDTAEYIELLMDGWVAVQYDGAVIADATGNLTVRQVAHMEKSRSLVEVAKEWLEAHGITLPELSR